MLLSLSTDGNKLNKNTLCQPFKSFSMLWRYSIPGFWCPKVNVVYTVQIHVLRMPSKCCFPHAKVQVGSINTFDLNAIVFTNKIKNGAQLVDVPGRLFRVSEGTRNIGSIHGIHKCDVLPIFPVQFFIIKVLWCSEPENIQQESENSRNIIAPIPFYIDNSALLLITFRQCLIRSDCCALNCQQHNNYVNNVTTMSTR